MPKYKSEEFLESSESSGDNSDSGDVKKTKKKDKKKEKSTEKKTEPPPAKKSKVEKASGDNDDDADCWEIGSTRKVTINEFRGKKLIDIREYYQKDGKELPGRKGISLNVQQWRALMDVSDQIDHALNKM